MRALALAAFDVAFSLPGAVALHLALGCIVLPLIALLLSVLGLMIVQGSNLSEVIS